MPEERAPMSWPLAVALITVLSPLVGVALYAIVTAAFAWGGPAVRYVAWVVLVFREWGA